MGRKKHINIDIYQKIKTIKVASIPLILYEEMFRSAVAHAIDDNNFECAQWFAQELLVRAREENRHEYNYLRSSGKLDSLKNLPCVECGQPADTIDHIIPLSRGGDNNLKNLQPMCWRCNRKKRDRLV